MGVLKKLFRRRAENKAIAEAKKHLKQNLDNFNAWMQLVEAYTLAGRNDEAIHVCKTLANATPEMVTPWVMLAMLYVDEAKGQEAANAAKKALALKPTSTGHYLLGRAYVQMRQWENAIPELNQTVETEQDNGMAWYWLGVAYQELGNTHDALSALKTASELESNTAEIWRDLSKIYLELQDGPKAVDAMERAAIIDPQYREIAREMDQTIGLEAVHETMSEINDVLEWLTSFTRFFMENHDVEPVTNAFMQDLPMFNEGFINKIKIIRETYQSDPSILPGGLIAQMIFVSTTTNLLHVYDNHISKGANYNEIKRAFKNSANQMLDGHEKMLH